MEPIKAEVVDDKAKRDRRGRQIVAAQRREELLAEYDASGLTQAAFARRAGINFHTLVAWLGRRRQSVVGGKQPVRFHELSVAALSAARTLPLEVTLPGGVIVRGGDASTLAELVRALRA